ncbi:MAG: hypothetical protein ACP5HM_16435 [Anaerolineae bacterium]
MNRKPIEFDDLVEQVNKPQVGKERLAIWGGTCAEVALEGFLDGWDLEQMPYRIWESTDRIDFGKDTPVPNVALLERGRLFGTGGDLDLRRDGDTFRWRFVGDPDVRPPAGYDAKENDFWAQEENQSTAFHCYKETALLWGKREGKRWHDNRVAAAELDYPTPDGAGRVQVTYKVYSRAGRVEFVWLTRLQEWTKEENDG